MNTVRVGAGTGFAGDRYDPASILARDADLDSLVFECLAERTIAIAHEQLQAGRGEGWDERIVRRIAETLPLLRGDATVVTNAGAANPRKAGRAVRDLVGTLNAGDRVVAAVRGDDVLAELDPASPILGSDLTLADLGSRVVSANAYAGIEGIMTALDGGASIVITGRVGDASLFLAPIAHRLGWDRRDLPLLAAGTLVGHLLECGGQLTGGYFADGDRKTAPGLARLGFPYADVELDGAAIYGKPGGTGGVLDRRTVLEQLLYEIDDPHRYLTPDVALDLTDVVIDDLGGDRVRVEGARAVGVTPTLKVSVGVRDGLIAVAEISYAGERCVERARMAADIVLERWRDVHGFDPDDVDVDVIGVNASRGWLIPESRPAEVRLRLSLRTFDREQARTLCEELEGLYTNGPAAGGGVTTSVRETIGIVSTLIPRDAVRPTVEFFA